MGLEKIITGGQTGADQGALDAAIEAGIAHGGWVPKGRRTEKGPLSKRYRLREMKTENKLRRTEMNLFEAQGTLIISRGKPNGGPELIHQLAGEHGFPCFHLDLAKDISVDVVGKVKAWVDQNKIKVLHVAGPKESKLPGIHGITFDIVSQIIKD
jgi:hypothetical protein